MPLCSACKTALLEDAISAPWGRVRDCSAAVMHKMEASRLTWANHAELRNIAMQTYTRLQNQRQQTKTTEAYCGFCFRTTGNKYPHAEEKCSKKKRADKAPAVADRAQQNEGNE